MKVRQGDAFSERLRERLAEESLIHQASRIRWVVPTQENNRKVVIAISFQRWAKVCRAAGRDNQGGTTGEYIRKAVSRL